MNIKRWHALVVVTCWALVAASPAHANKHARHRQHATTDKSHAGSDEIQRNVLAQPPQKKDKNNNTEQIEEIDQVEMIDPGVAQPNSGAQANPTAAGSSGFSAMIKPEAMSASMIALLGHLHPAAVHLPIAWAVLWAAVEVFGPPLGLAPLAAAALPLGVATVISFFPSVVTGLSRLTELTTAARGGDYDAVLALTHRNLMFVSWAILAGALLLRIFWARWPLRAIRRCYVLALVVATLIVLYSAHLGGRLVYGDDFIPLPF